MEVFGTPLKHPIDGDGLVGRLTFHGGRFPSASFTTRFVSTATRMEEQKKKTMIFPGQMGSRPPGSENRFRDPSHTNVFAWGGRLLACHEYTLPHELDPRTLRTLGPTDLGGVLKRTKSLCAHYRVDPKSGNIATVSFRATRLALGSPARPSQLHICEFDKKWTLQHEVYHEIPGLDYCHDLAVTPSYYVVHQTPFVKVTLDMAVEVVSGKCMPGEQMRLYEDRPCRMILLPRSGGRPIHVDLPEPCHVFHFGNASERDDYLEVDIVALGREFNMDFQHSLWLSNANDAPGLLTRIRIDLKTMRCIYYRVVDGASCEFPTLHPNMHVTAKEDPVPRFTYLMANDSGLRIPFTHVVKVDRLGEHRQFYSFDGCTVGEPCFVPRSLQSREDDGYIVVQVYSLADHRTRFAVLDAMDLSNGPVCELDLGIFLPNAFHGTWCDEVFEVAPSDSKL